MSTPKAQGPIWARPAPGERKPRFTRDQLAAAALKIADEEGIEAVSMRRVASELGAGTMTLYHYVANKNELLSLMANAIMGELVVPDDELADNWRDALAQLARRTYQVFHNHGWSFDQMGEGDGGVGGPNGMRHFDQSLRAIALTGLGPDDQLELVTLTDDYIFGFVKRELSADVPMDEAMPEEAWTYMRELLATGEYPHIEQLMGDGEPEEVFARFVDTYTAPDRFERGLRILLDGIELEIERRGGRT